MRTTRPWMWLLAKSKTWGMSLIGGERRSGELRAGQATAPYAGLEWLEPRILMHAELPSLNLPDRDLPGQALVADVLEASEVHDDALKASRSGSALRASIGFLNGASSSHYLVAPDSGGYFRQKDMIPSTPVRDIYYDFRSEGGYPNLITAAEMSEVASMLSAWKSATGGNLNFIRNTSAPASSIINIGVGDMAAVGYSGASYLGISINSNSAYDHSIFYSTAWLNKNYSWDTAIGNGDRSGVYDFFTSVAHEVGHSLGLGHMSDLAGDDFMDSPYPGEMTAPSSNDLYYIRSLYGNGGSTSTGTTGTGTGTGGGTTTTSSSPSSPGIKVTPTSGLVTTEASGPSSFNLVLTTKPNANVTVPLGVSDTTEGTLNKWTVTFTPTNWSTPQYVTVTGLDDSVRDGDVAYTVYVRKASSSDANYDNRDPWDVQAVNRDNEGSTSTSTSTGTGSTGSTSLIKVTPTTGEYTSESSGTTPFSVVLASKPSYNVTIPLGVSDSTEGTLSRWILTFTPSNWSTPQYVSIVGVDDQIVDGNVAYTVYLRKASSSDTRFDNVDAADVLAVNRDNDVASGLLPVAAAQEPLSGATRGGHLSAPGSIVDLLSEAGAA